MSGESHLVVDLVSALERGDERAIDTAVSSILRAIEHDADSLGDDEVARINDLLRDQQQHEYMIAYGETLSSEGRNTFNTDKHYAQALIDKGVPKKALALLRSMASVSDNRNNFDHYSEAMGLIGRIHKDLYLQAVENDRDTAKKHLEKSLSAYGEPWRREPERCEWHAVNMLALISSASLKGIKLPAGFNDVEIADSVVSTIEKIPEDGRDYWNWASLAEALVSKGEWAAASKALLGAIEAPGANPFSLNGTLRQFKEVWCLQDRNDASAMLVTWLERTLIAQPNSELLLDVDDIERQQSVQEGDLEALHSHHRMRSNVWLQNFLLRGESVASIVDVNSGEPRGTCCLIDGGLVSDAFDGKVLCLTNDHVISEHPDQYSRSRKPLAPGQAAVKFTQSGLPEKKYLVSNVIWSSPYHAHDTCLFELEEEPPLTRSTIPVVSYVPAVGAEKPQEVFIISHPEKEALSFSFQNTDLIDHDAEARGKASLIPGLIHYTTPTVPGSSGGVALNAQLEMIGLHHAGGSEISKLNGNVGTYEVNEAVWIQPVLNAVRRGLRAGISRWTD